jgi:hypothetical protein
MAVEGRRKLELGVPPSADLGDVVHSLMALYPKLAAHVPSDRRPIRQHLSLYLSGRLHEGQTIYLFASAATPPALAPRRTKG